MRVKLTVGYDGTEYSGWQIQKDKKTVQGVLQECIFALTKERVNVVGSGRTDAGVHALAQVCHFDTLSSIPAEKFYLALNTLLPSDIKVLSSEKADKDFNARKSAKKKTYGYFTYLADTELPLKERYATRLIKKPNIKSMKKAAKVLVGEHDFKAFCASNSSVKTTVRTLYRIKITNRDGGINFFFTGNGFLYNMVRNLVGTLLKVGYGDTDIKSVQNMLRSGDKDKIYTMPAKGLTLIKVEYSHK